MATGLDSKAEKSYEIDLREVVLSILGAWYWIAGVLVVSVSLAIIYLWLATPVYEARFRATPSATSNFSDFNHFNDFQIAPEDAYRALGNRLTSFQNFESFVERHRNDLSLDAEAELAELFQERFDFGGLVVSPAGNTILNVRYRYPEGESGDRLLNQYITETSKIVWSVLNARFNSYNEAQLNLLHINLELEKNALRSEREEELFDIEKAIAIARSLNIETPTIPYDLNPEADSTQIIFMGKQGFPRYYMGFQVLESEKNELTLALNEGLSNKKIREVQRNIDIRKQVSESINEGELSRSEERYYPLTERVVDVIEYAFPEERKVSPNSILALVLSIILGSFIGLIIVLIKISFRAK